MEKTLFKSKTFKKLKLKKKRHLNFMSRESEIIPKFLGLNFRVHNGKSFVEFNVIGNMIGHKFGEFIFTRKRFSFKKKNLKEEDVICYTKDGVFVMLQLVLLAGSYLNDELFYDIYDFYLVSKPAEIRKQVHREAILFLDELGVKLNLHVKWDNFKIPFAYYLIQINNIVKGGIVGEKEESKDENLDFRLATHRSTYARFKLVNVFEFQNSSTVKLFEQAIKHVLSPHSIGKVDNLKMEQYECPGKDTGLVINNLVSKQFKYMNFEITQLGTECPKEHIDNYNKNNSKRVGYCNRSRF